MFDYNPDIFEEAIKCAKKASIAFENLDSMVGKVKNCDIPASFSCDLALRDTLSLILDEGDKIITIPDYLVLMKEKLDADSLIDGKNSDFLNLENEFRDILSTKGINGFTNSLISSLSSKDLSSIEAMTLLLPSFIRSGDLNIDNISGIIQELYTNNIISNSEVNSFLSELRRTNLNYVTNEGSIGSLQQTLNDHYNYDYDYVVIERNEDEYSFKINSVYEFNIGDINTLLKPLYDKGIISISDMEEMVSSLHIFDKPTGDPNKYFNPDINEHLLKNYDANRFYLTVNNKAYEFNETDAKYAKLIPFFKDYYTDDEEYNDVIAKLCASDYIEAIHTRESGSDKDNIDETLALYSLVINRTESESYNYDTNGEGNSIIYQLIKGTQIDPKYNASASAYLGQLQYSDFIPEGKKGSCAQYLNGRTFNTVEEAAIDSMNGIRNTDCLMYPANPGGGGNLTDMGNWFMRGDMNSTKETVMADKMVEYTGEIYDPTKDNQNYGFTSVIKKSESETDYSSSEPLGIQNSGDTSNDDSYLAPTNPDNGTYTGDSNSGSGYYSGGGNYGGGGYSDNTPATPTIETPSIVETTPIAETTPVVETTPIAETTPVVETTPIVETTPVVETPAIIDSTPQTIENIIYTSSNDISSTTNQVESELSSENVELAMSDNPIVDSPLTESVINSPVVESIKDTPIVKETPIISIPDPTPIVNNNNSNGNGWGTAAIIGGLGAVATGGYIVSKKIKENKEKDDNN